MAACPTLPPGANFATLGRRESDHWSIRAFWWRGSLWLGQPCSTPSQLLFNCQPTRPPCWQYRYCRSLFKGPGRNFLHSHWLVLGKECFFHLPYTVQQWIVDSVWGSIIGCHNGRPLLWLVTWEAPACSPVDYMAAAKHPTRWSSASV